MRQEIRGEMKAIPTSHRIQSRQSNGHTCKKSNEINSRRPGEIDRSGHRRDCRDRRGRAGSMGGGTPTERERRGGDKPGGGPWLNYRKPDSDKSLRREETPQLVCSSSHSSSGVSPWHDSKKHWGKEVENDSLSAVIRGQLPRSKCWFPCRAHTSRSFHPRALGVPLLNSSGTSR